MKLRQVLPLSGLLPSWLVALGSTAAAVVLGRRGGRKETTAERLWFAPARWVGVAVAGPLHSLANGAVGVAAGFGGPPVRGKYLVVV